MEGCNFKIVIIDDGVNMELLYELRNKRDSITCLQVQNGICIAQNIVPLQVINHGTVCMSILLECLEAEGILDNVKIISISVLDEGKQNNLQKLSEAIRWAIDHKVDLISLSIGSKEFISSNKIIEVLKKNEKEDTVIVAAGANDGTITYPACLPYVVGVRAADLVLGKENVYMNPVDGINIQEYVPRLNILKILEQKFNYYLSPTNSLLAPVVAAQIADIILQKEKNIGIKAIKKLIAIKKNLKVVNDNYDYPPLKTVARIKEIEEIQIPIIAIEYNDSNKRSIEKLAIEMQQKFIKNEYSCAYISDTISENYFEQNRFKLPSKNAREWMCFYANFLNVNIIIVSIKEHINLLISSSLIDAIISPNKEKYFGCPAYYIKLTDVELISQDLFKWIINLFD